MAEIKTSIDYAKEYVSNGLNVIPVPYGQKEPVIKWKKYQTEKIIVEDINKIFEWNSNIAVVNGKTSNIVTFDIDKENPHFTEYIFKKSVPQISSETMVVSSRRGVHIHFSVDPLNFDIIRDLELSFRDNDPIYKIEFFCEGHLTLIPPSNVDGHQYKVMGTDKINCINLKDLKEILDRISYLQENKELINLFLPYWSAGRRNKLALGLIGALKKHWSMSQAESTKLIETICRLAGDEEIFERKSLVIYTYKLPDAKIAIKTNFDDVDAELYSKYQNILKNRRFDSGKETPWMFDETLMVIRQSCINMDENGKECGINYQLLANEISKLEMYADMIPLDILYVYDRKRGMWCEDGEFVISQYLGKIVPDFLTVKTKNEVVNWVKCLYQQSAGSFCMGIENDLLNLKNGVLNVKTFELYPHSPDFKFMWQIPRTWKSTLTEKDVDEMGKVLNALFEWSLPNLEMFFSLLEYLAYPLVNICIKKAVLLIGERDRGKSQFIRLIQNLYGLENITNKTLQEITSDNFALKSLVNKFANIFADVPKQGLSRNEVGLFKTLTGGDTIDIRVMYSQKSLKMKTAPKLIFSANYSLDVTEENISDDAYFGRWQLEKFENTIPDEVRLPENILMKKISSEESLDSLFPLLILISNNIKKRGGFSFEKELNDLRESYQLTTDSLLPKFTNRYLASSGDNEEFIIFSDLNNKLHNYANEMGIVCPSIKSFSIFLKNKFSIIEQDTRENGKKIVKYYGIKWKPENEIIEKDLNNKLIKPSLEPDLFRLLLNQCIFNQKPEFFTKNTILSAHDQQPWANRGLTSNAPQIGLNLNCEDGVLLTMEAIFYLVEKIYIIYREKYMLLLGGKIGCATLNNKTDLNTKTAELNTVTEIRTENTITPIQTEFPDKDIKIKTSDFSDKTKDIFIDDDHDIKDDEVFDEVGD